MTRSGPASLASIPQEQKEILTPPKNRRIPLEDQLQSLYKYFSSSVLLSERIFAGSDVTSGKSAMLQQRGSPGHRRGHRKRTLPPKSRVPT